MLPSKYRMEIFTEIHESLMIKLPFLANKPFTVFIELFKVMNMKYQADEEILWNQGTYLDKIFIIGNGKVAFTEKLLHKYNLTVDGIFEVKN